MIYKFLFNFGSFFAKKIKNNEREKEKYSKKVLNKIF